MGIASELAWVALSLYEEEAHRREHKQVALVDASVVGEELEVRPSPVGFVVGKSFAHEVQRFLFPGELRS